MFSDRHWQTRNEIKTIESWTGRWNRRKPSSRQSADLRLISRTYVSGVNDKLWQSVKKWSTLIEGLFFLEECMLNVLQNEKMLVSTYIFTILTKWQPWYVVKEPECMTVWLQVCGVTRITRGVTMYLPCTENSHCSYRMAFTYLWKDFRYLVKYCGIVNRFSWSPQDLIPLLNMLEQASVSAC